MESEEQTYNAAAVLKAFETEPLKSLPSLRHKVLMGEVYACSYQVENPDTEETEEFILFDLETPARYGEWRLQAEKYKDEIARHATRYYRGGLERILS